MTSTLIAIFGTALSGLLLFVVEWIKTGSAQKTGGVIEAAKTDEVTVKATTAIAAAVVAAPTTRLALVDQLKAGKF